MRCRLCDSKIYRRNSESALYYSLKCRNIDHSFQNEIKKRAKPTDDRPDGPRTSACIENANDKTNAMIDDATMVMNSDDDTNVPSSALLSAVLYILA
jgi:hypothetical protein